MNYNLEPLSTLSLYAFSPIKSSAEGSSELHTSENASGRDRPLGFHLRMPVSEEEGGMIPNNR